MLTNVMEQYTYLNSIQPIPSRVESLKQRIAQESDPQQKAALERQISNSLAYLEQVKEIKVTPPNMTFDATMTLVRGGREIRIVYLGRGHTDTDVVVLLPKERIVCTGDLMESVISYMGDSYPEEWIATLERLKTLDFDTVMPDTASCSRGRRRLRRFRSTCVMWSRRWPRCANRDSLPRRRRRRWMSPPTGTSSRQFAASASIRRPCEGSINWPSIQTQRADDPRVKFVDDPLTFRRS
jgi:hypothetical protein